MDKEQMISRLGVLEMKIQDSVKFFKKCLSTNPGRAGEIKIFLRVLNGEKDAVKHAMKALKENCDFMNKLSRLLFACNKRRLELPDERDYYSGMTKGFAMALSMMHFSPTVEENIPF